LKKSGPEGI